MVKRLIIRFIATCIILIGLFFTLGIVLCCIDAMEGKGSLKFINLLHAPFYLLLVVSGVGIMRLRRWAVYLLYGLLIFDILYWFIPGFYQGLFKMIMDPQRSEMSRVLIFLYLCYKRFLIPILAYGIFSHTRLKTEFQKKVE